MMADSSTRALVLAAVLAVLPGLASDLRAQGPALSDASAVPGNVAAQRKQADQLFEQGRLDEAKVIYARVASFYAKEFEFNMRLAYCYFVSKKNEMAKAAVYYGRAHALKPKNLEAEMNWAKTLSWSKQYPQAIGAFRALVARDPANRDALLELARAQNYGGDADGARASYEAYLKRWPSDRDVRVEYANWLSWNKHFDDALENYRIVLKTEPHNPTVLAGEAQIFAWKGDLQQALQVYDEALARAPKLYVALRGKAFTLLWMQKYEDAARVFAEANKRKPPDAEVTQALAAIAQWRAAEPERQRLAKLDVYLRPADAAMARKDFPAAIELFRKALMVSSGNQEIRFRLGEACLWDRRWSDAIEIFSSLNTEHPGNLNVVRELGHAYTGAKRLADAANLFHAYLQQSPDANIRVELAQVLSWSGKLDESAVEFHAILKEQPDNFDAALGLAQVTAWQGHAAEALAQFEDLLRRRPDSREAQLGRAQVLSWSGRGKDAIPLLEAMLREHPQDREIAGVLQSVQDSLRQQQELQQSASARAEDVKTNIARDEAALQQHPSDTKLLQRIADRYSQLGQYKDAIAYYDKALAITPDDTALVLTLARVMSWDRDFARSVEMYRRLVAKDNKPEYGVEMARVLSWAGRNAESIAEYRKLLERDPDNTAVRLGLARVLSWDKQSDEAVAEYTRVLEKDPHNRDALFERARAYAWKGDFKAALRMYDTLLLSAPTDREVRLAKAQVLNWSGQPREAKRILVDMQKGHAEDRDVTLANAAVESSLGRRDVALRLLDDLDKLQPGNHDVEALRRSIREDLRPTLVLGFTPSFDSDNTDIYASTASFYFSPQPRIRSYFATNIIPSFVTTRYDSESGREFLFGSYGRVNSWLQLRGEIGANVPSTGEVSPIGSGGATLFATDRMQFDFDVARRFINYLPQPLLLDISRMQYRAAWNWRATRRTAFHIDYYHEDYSDHNHNNAANFSVLETVLKKEHFELEAGYLFAISGFDHEGNSGYFTPTSFQRHAVLGNTRINFSQRTGVSFWGSLGREEVFDQAFRLDGTARAAWDYKITPKVKVSLGYGYFAVSSVGGSTAYVTHTGYSNLQYVF